MKETSLQSRTIAHQMVNSPGLFGKPMQTWSNWRGDNPSDVCCAVISVWGRPCWISSIWRRGPERPKSGPCMSSQCSSRLLAVFLVAGSTHTRRGVSCNSTLLRQGCYKLKHRHFRREAWLWRPTSRKKDMEGTHEGFSVAGLSLPVASDPACGPLSVHVRSPQVVGWSLMG